MEYNQIKNIKISKLTLGTAQLGLDYGIGNMTGKPSRQHACNILKVATNSGINIFDTAINYGNSEEILGSFLKNFSFSISPVVITKIPKINLIKPSFDKLYFHIHKLLIESRKRLKINPILICLLHDPSDMYNFNGQVVDCLLKMKKEELVNYIGVSTYIPEEAKEFLKINKFDVIQVPINIFDTRLIETGILDKLYKKETIIFGRSIFLQGLFAINLSKIPKFLKKATKPLNVLYDISSDLGIKPIDLAFLFVRDFVNVHSMVIGIETIKQLKYNLDLMHAPPLKKEIKKLIIEIFHDMPEDLLNPSKWNYGNKIK